ncbi:50S ribosomal protein L1 [Desulfovibrio aerotolerans]|uniref:Large ribosomal subunit protein uL1 n=1 Tax=Solidesulfovibrio aerotolerans TaxID=295255 RepID=A0A7C9IV22_9BACT|nr:50S ribosomal protein L1 [Solidesulfovibrio aerotolerans]MYL83303.1 50S ribosomal protein L1 [Solidesulfovibrio aerotolerans]
MAKHGKNYREAIKDIDLTVKYDVNQAMTLTVETGKAKFDETVDVALNLGVNPKYSDQMVRGAVSLPHGLGKTVRVLAFCKGDKEAEAREAGADFVGGDELIEQVKNGFLAFDNAVATPDMMASVGKIGKILGPRGLMPNAKTGTVSFDIGKAVAELKAGKVEFKVDKAGVLHVPLGKRSFGAEKLLDNFRAVIDAVMRLKPSAAKGTYLQGMALATTMGPGIKVDTQSVRKLIEG